MVSDGFRLVSKENAANEEIEKLKNGIEQVKIGNRKLIKESEDKELIIRNVLKATKINNNKNT